MNGNDSFKRCRRCGKMIGIIKERAYRKIIVDAEAVPVVPDPLGETFIRIDGSKLRGKELSIDAAVALERGTSKNATEYVYRPHTKCRGYEDEM